jgi:hypothetical protein
VVKYFPLIRHPDELKSGDYSKKIFLLVGENFSEIEKVIDILNQKGIEFAGAIFPKVIYKEKAYDDAIILWKLEDEKIFYFEDMGSVKLENLKQYGENIYKSALVFVDGLSPYIRNFLDRIHEAYGNKVKVAGGGAGSVIKDIKPIITPKGLIKGGAAGFFLNKQIIVTVGHGWQRFYGPLIATKTKGNIIIELNWQPALEVYRQILKELTGIEVTKENFFDVAKFYPFGMIREGEEDIVRDPIKVFDDMSIECVGDIPENSVLFIMKGETEKLIEGSKKTCSNISNGTKIVFDCVSRTMVLGEHFKEELKNFGPDSVGILTVGEIAPLSNGYPMFYNKTTVCLTIKR